MMARPRRTSSLGEDIRGDTSAPGISTMSTSPAQRAASRSRRRALSRDRRSTKSRTSNFFTWYREVSYRKTWLNPLVAMLSVVLAYAVNPVPSNPASGFLFLSYPEPSNPASHAPTQVQYGKGRKDFLYVLFYTFFFSFTREFLMQQILRPLAHLCNITKKPRVSRFMEQTYTAVYFSVFGPFGLYVMYGTPIWYFNTTAFYTNYPHYTHTADFKAYYLLQAAYWAQQAIVLMLQLEKPRKDFKELVMHHIVTLSLIGLSYRFHFTWIGIAVFVTHDISDFFLATSKTLNYLDHRFTGPYFGFFIFVWIYTRHYINLKVIYSILTEFETVGVWELNWTTQVYKSRIAQVIAGGLLGSLQAVNLFWLWLILRVAWRYVVSNVAQDERSDDEDDENSENSAENENETPRIEITASKDEPEPKKDL